MSFIHSGGHIWPAEQTHMIVDFFKRQGQSSNLSAKRDVPHLAGVLP
ncbi:MAG: hypothetical protein HY080_17650 [Gammaproteobacteria bacterium]|nr:hypothetical protein [Gammaproteobacteria bacterium]